MDLQSLLEAVKAWPISTAIREDGMWFPLIECTHVLAVTSVVGSIAVVDLRLLGVSSLNRAVTKLTDELLPYTWSAFVLAAITGGLLFMSKAPDYVKNGFFLAKMLLLVAAFFNMLIFHLVTFKGVARWDESPRTPAAARAAGLSSICLWIVIVACGRWIGFTMSPF